MKPDTYFKKDLVFRAFSVVLAGLDLASKVEFRGVSTAIPRKTLRVRAL